MDMDMDMDMFLLAGSREDRRRWTARAAARAAATPRPIERAGAKALIIVGRLART